VNVALRHKSAWKPQELFNDEQYNSNVALRHKFEVGMEAARTTQ
jgi:hypothetical protein